MAKVVENGKELKETKNLEEKQVRAERGVEYKTELVANYMECVSTEIERWKIFEEKGLNKGPNRLDPKVSVNKGKNEFH